jgi:hypothetical protein
METSLKAKWYTYPTKKHVTLFTTLWFAGIVLLIVGTTSAFTESFFNRSNIFISIVMIGATITTGRLIRNYFRNKQDV